MEIVDGLLSQDYFFAQAFALNAHNKQTRKGKRTPYAAHLLDVVSTLVKSGATETELIAGWLHDVVEDTVYTLDNVRIIFGDEVADLVTLLSEGDFAQGFPSHQNYSENSRMSCSWLTHLLRCAAPLT